MRTHKPSQLAVLVACERSQIVANAFRALGHYAFSADIELCLGGHPEWHIIGDVQRILNGHCAFTTQDTVTHQIRTNWDLIIAHPPCTYLAKSGSMHMYCADGSINLDRAHLRAAARIFFLRCLHADAAHVCVENPVPMKDSFLPRPDTIIDPCEFGEPWTKKTCLWLRDLPPLLPTCIHTRTRSFVYTKRGSKARSLFFPKVAKAMAEQWTSYIMDKKELQF